MAQEYCNQPYDKYFPVNRSHQRQSLAVQWQQCHSDNGVGSYQQTLWPQNAYTQSESTINGVSTPECDPRIHAYESNHPRSLSPVFQGKQWPNDVIYSNAIPSAIAPVPASSPQHSLPSRPATAATGAAPRIIGAPAQPPRSSSAQSSPERQRPKIEVSEDVQIGFVMESMGAVVGRTSVVATLLPMEVPLRATQASGDMRKMMTVFRLNPFALQSGEAKRSGSICSSDSSSSTDSLESSPPQFEARPLEEEPLIFEFQVQLDDPELLVPESERLQEYAQVGEEKLHDGKTVDSPLSCSPLPLLDVSREDTLHSFPPEFELHREVYDYQANAHTGSSWERPEYAPSSTASSAWDRNAALHRHSQSSSLEPHALRSSSPSLYLRKTARNGYQYPSEPHFMTAAPLPPSHREVYSSMETSRGYSEEYHPAPPRSRTESPLTDETCHQRPIRNLTIDNSDIYSHSHSTSFYANAGDVIEDPSTTSSHRRWSFPPEASGAQMMVTSHGMNHVHGRMAMASHSNETFLVPQMR